MGHQHGQHGGKQYPFRNIFRLFVSYLEEDGEEDDDQGGGEHHMSGPHGLLVQHLDQGEGDGAPQAAVPHDELLLEVYLLDAEHVGDPGQHQHSWRQISLGSAKSFNPVPEFFAHFIVVFSKM